MSGFLNVLTSVNAAVGAPAFPTLSGLLAHWRADTGVTTSGGNVTSVAGQDGTSYALTNNGTVPLNLTSAYNGKPAFDFTAANDAALCTATLATPVVTLSPANRLSIFMVGRMTTSTANFGRLISIGEGGLADFQSAGNIAALTRTGTTASIETYYNGGATQIDTSMSTGANHRFGLVVDGTNATHYVDNSIGSQAPISLSLTSPNNIIVGNFYGAGGSGGGLTGNAWDGPILDIVICSAALNSTERSNLDAWFTGTYGA